MDIVINEISDEKLSLFWTLLERYSGWVDRDYYEYCLERAKQGDMQIFTACLADGEMIGHCLLNWVPRYAMFKALGVPEIQDLNVVREYRQKGVGRRIIAFCEDKARLRGREMMGIGVGMDHSFGAAQRLYVAMGYMPDGNGVTYDRKPVSIGELKPIDGNLSLMMTKTL